MKTILIYSGGLDSTTLLYWFLDKKYDIKALSFNYGQRHSRELEFAKKNCLKLGVEHQVVDLSSIKGLLKGSSQTDDTVEVPEGHYEAESMKSTVVPNRNSIMLNIAAAWAMSSKYDSVSCAVHSGDHFIYLDCRPEFVSSLQQTIQLADEHKVTIERPFIGITKAGIAKIAEELGVSIADTYSCYKGGPIACGKCGTDVERINALREAGVVDPTQYLDAEYSKQYA